MRKNRAVDCVELCLLRYSITGVFTHRKPIERLSILFFLYSYKHFSKFNTNSTNIDLQRIKKTLVNEGQKTKAAVTLELKKRAKQTNKQTNKQTKSVYIARTADT